MNIEEINRKVSEFMGLIFGGYDPDIDEIYEASTCDPTNEREDTPYTSSLDKLAPVWGFLGTFPIISMKGDLYEVSFSLCKFKRTIIVTGSNLQLVAAEATAIAIGVYEKNKEIESEEE